MMRSPRIKPEHQPYLLETGRIRIGGGVYGIAAEIESDQDGMVWAALQSLDGTRTTEEVISFLCSRFPHRQALELRQAVDQIIGSGYVEDAGAPVPGELSERDRERYQRGAAFFRWVDLSPRSSPWEAQLRLRGARVLVVGAGGTGSTALYALAASGVGRLHCVDGDAVSLSNLNRQVLFTEADIGRPKAEVAAERLALVNSDIHVTSEQRRIDSQITLCELVRDHDILALCADEPAGPGGIRSWASRACLAASRPWVGGGYHGPLVTVGAYLPDGGPCYECLEAGERERQDKTAPRAPEFSDFLVRLGGPGATAATAGISGHLIAHAVIAVLTGAPALPKNCIFGVNLVAPDDQTIVRHPRLPGCPGCGTWADSSRREARPE
jgi:molybdopterin/thiamine biosynthesis adenylyltransferase